jgi:hypothetical protein
MSSSYDIVLRVGSTRIAVPISSLDVHLRDLLILGGLNPDRVRLIHKGKRILTCDEPVRGMYTKYNSETLMVICDAGYKPFLGDPPDATLSDSLESVHIFSSSPEAIGSGVGDTTNLFLSIRHSSDISDHVVIRDGRVKYSVEFGPRESTVKDIFVVLNSALRLSGCELINSGKVFSKENETLLSDLKSKEFMLRRSADFWKAADKTEQYEEEMRYMGTLLARANHLLKSRSVDAVSRRLELSSLRDEMMSVFKNMEDGQVLAGAVRASRLDSAMKDLNEMVHLIDEALAIMNNN